MYTPSLEQLAQLDRAFHYHPPVGNQAERYQRLRSQAMSLAMVLITNAPPSRELSLAQTHLEQAVMWAIAAIARNESPRPAAKPATASPALGEVDLNGMPVAATNVPQGALP